MAFHIPNEGENSIRVLNQPHTAVGDAGGQKLTVEGENTTVAVWF